MIDNAIIDANFFIALSFPKDPHHIKAEKMFSEVKKHRPIFYTNNYLLAEVYTILLIRTKSIKAVHFLRQEILEKYKDVLVVFQASKEFDEEVCQVFINQKKYKGGFLSFADCSLVVQGRLQNIKTIFTLDKTLKQFGKEFDIVEV